MSLLFSKILLLYGCIHQICVQFFNWKLKLVGPTMRNRSRDCVLCCWKCVDASLKRKAYEISQLLISVYYFSTDKQFCINEAAKSLAWMNVLPSKYCLEFYNSFSKLLCLFRKIKSKNFHNCILNLLSLDYPRKFFRLKKLKMNKKVFFVSVEFIRYKSF